MSKRDKPISAAQLERRQAAQTRCQRRDQFLTIITIGVAAGFIGF